MKRPDRRKTYFWLMGTCVTLIVLAWFVVRLFSIPAAIGMSIVAAVIPPIAAIAGNWPEQD
jgi:CHASE2 domain-containing sensor protein